MTTRKSVGRQAGFTLVELLVVTAVLIGLLLPMTQQFQSVIAGVRVFRDLKAIGDMAERARYVQELAALRFLHFVSRDSTGDPDAVDIEPLRTFCGAETTLQEIRERAESVLKTTTSQRKRRVLTDFIETVDGKVVPVLRKMDETLRTRAPGFCD
jgi:prepilin-type N-terminal cleavage/methylation domain-containing protein